jgi:fucose 4-O-acetylase-like acetyltransferase
MTSSRYSEVFLIELSYIQNFVDGAVAGFFLISGFFFKKDLSFKSLIFKKFKSLILPYIIFSLLYSILLSIIGKGDFFNGLINTLLLHGGSMQLYFLPYLFITLSIFWIFMHITSNFNTNFKYLVLIIILLIICFLFPLKSSSGNDYFQVPFYFISFILGFIFKNLNLNKLKEMIYISVLTIFITLIGFIDQRFYDLALILILFYIFLIVGKKLPSKKLSGSGGIYLLHTPILNFSISTILQKFGIIDFNNFIFSVILTYLICLILVYSWLKFNSRYSWILLE